MTTEHYDIGAPVQVGSHAGRVLRIQIVIGPAILYEVGYWNGDGEWREFWFNAFMVSPTGEKPAIGYLPSKKKSV